MLCIGVWSIERSIESIFFLFGNLVRVLIFLIEVNLLFIELFLILRVFVFLVKLLIILVGVIIFLLENVIVDGLIKSFLRFLRFVFLVVWIKIEFLIILNLILFLWSEWCKLVFCLIVRLCELIIMIFVVVFIFLVISLICLVFFVIIVLFISFIFVFIFWDRYKKIVFKFRYESIICYFIMMFCVLVGILWVLFFYCFRLVLLEILNSIIYNFSIVNNFYYFFEIIL